MKIEITLDKFQETLEGKDAEELLHRAKIEAASRAPFLVRAVINGMSDLAFADEVIKRANARDRRNDPAPQNAQAFLDWAVQRGYARVLQP